MRNTKAFATLVFILTTLMMLCMVTTTVFATDEIVTQPPAAEETQQQEQTDPPVVETETVEEPDDTGDYDDSDTTQDYDTEYIEETEEQTEPETNYEVYGDTLPQVESQEITEPTTMEIPDVEVSDTSLLGGVIAWLCVAVGIAVIAGVLVSQRTRQTTHSNSRDNRRR